MKTYRIQCEESERAEVMRILRKYNDVVIDNVDSHSFGITIEADNGDAYYERLLDEIEREVFRYRQERENYSRQSPVDSPQS